MSLPQQASLEHSLPFCHLDDMAAKKQNNFPK